MATTPEHQEWYSFLIKSGTWLISAISIMIGVVGKICYELAIKRKLSILQWVGVAGVSVFVGYITAVWCNSNDLESQGYVIVPVSTLFGERIVIYLTANYQRILSGLFELFMKKK